MSEASAASQLASVMRSSVSHHARSVREAVKPSHVADSLKVSAAKNSTQASAGFDATGKVTSSSESPKTGSSTGNILDLLA